MKTEQQNKSRQKSSRSARLSANMEDYLEVIYSLAEASGVSRVSKIAEVVGVKRPSVSKALKRLKREGLVAHAPYGGATLTERGLEVARAQIRSHRALTRFLEQVLALDAELADHDACLMEHAISLETVERLVRFVDFLDQNGGSVVDSFRASLNQDDAPQQESVRRRGKRGSPAAVVPAAGRKWTSRV